MESWRAPLDEFTMRYFMSRLVEDRERHLAEASDLRQYDATAGEAFMVRAEECARVIGQIKKILGIRSEPPPPRRKQWPDV